MAQSTITSATPGNMVVPLSAIIDQLQGKLSAADLNALLLAVVAQKRNEVRPSDLADLQGRVAALEGATGPAGPLNISKVLPPTLRMGEELKVFGSGLLPS